MFDGLLRLHQPDDIPLRACAHGIAIVTVRKHLDEIATPYSITMKSMDGGRD